MGQKVKPISIRLGINKKSISCWYANKKNYAKTLYSDYQIQPDFPYLLMLGFITTALGHTLFLSSFSHFSISTASIISSIQPLFGIIMSVILLNEIQNFKNVVGGIIILSTVVIESIKSKEKKS